MLKIFGLLTILSSTTVINAQSLSPTVISSTGGFSTNATGSLSYTVGETTLVQTLTANSNILTQGLQGNLGNLKNS